MKIHLVLDYNGEISVGNDDVVIITPFNQHVSLDHNVIIADSSIVALDSALRDEVRAFYNKVPSKYSVSQNIIYDRVFKPIYAIIAVVNDCLKNNKDSDIILYGGSDYSYVTVVGGEGEGYRKDFQLNWMVNAIIYQTFRKNYPIIWKHKGNSTLFKIKNYIRWRRQYLKVTLSYLKQSFSLLKEGHFNPLSSLNYVAIVDLPLQINYLERLLQGTKAESIVYLTANTPCCEALKYKGKLFCQIPPLSIWGLFSILFTNTISKKEKKVIRVPKSGMSIYPLIREIRYCSFIYEVRFRRLLSVCNKVFDENSPKTLITMFTVGNDIVTAHNLAMHKEWRHINFQGVTMGRILYPQLELADEYYLYSKRTFDCYKKYSDSYKFYLPVFHNDENERHSGLVLTLFLQPDSYIYDYFPFIKWLTSVDWNHYNLAVVIKPHYRQNELNSVFEMVKQNPSIRVADKMEDCPTLLKNTNIAVSMHSSVLFESMASGVLTLVYNPNGKYDNEVYNEDVCFPEVNFVITKAEQTLQYVENYDHYIPLFNQRRENYISKNGGMSDINKLFETI